MDSHEEDVAWLKSTFRPIPRPALPDDCIEYSLYVLDSSLDPANDSELRLQLRNVQKAATSLHKDWLKEYIWQRQPFNLELMRENGEVGIQSGGAGKVSSNKSLGVSFLHGRTEYGDSIEDEWVVVWLLRELTTKFSNLWVKVSDSDGEFLLIEASGTLPSWLEPDVAENRVWINNGQLKVIKPASKSKSPKHTEEKLGLKEAQNILLHEAKRVMHSTSMEEEAFYRLRNYPGQIYDNMHHAIVKLPRKIVYLLLQKPAYVAAAIEAFYLRDPISLKPLQSKDASNRLIFPPFDLVEFSVRFPRVAYAQIKSQDFPAPEFWKPIISQITNEVDRAQTDTGMKLTCGFEMLLCDTQSQDRPVVREMQLLLEELDNGDMFVPTDDELSQLEKQSDDEKWMDISYDDLQTELNMQKGATSTKKPEFGDKAAQANLQRIVKQFEQFLNDDQMDESGLFGEGDSDAEDLDDIDSDDLEEDKDASFAEDDFTKLMQEMMGLPPEVMDEMMKGDIDAFKNGAQPPGQSFRSHANDKEDEDNAEDVEIRELTKQFGKELRAYGALGRDPTGTSSRAIVGGETMALNELSSDDEDMLDNDIDAELTKNLLQSFRSQAGIGGPASNLMAMMTEQEAGPSSATQGNTRKGKETTGTDSGMHELIEDVD